MFRNLPAGSDNDLTNSAKKWQGQTRLIRAMLSTRRHAQFAKTDHVLSGSKMRRRRCQATWRLQQDARAPCSHKGNSDLECWLLDSVANSIINLIANSIVDSIVDPFANSTASWILDWIQNSIGSSIANSANGRQTNPPKCRLDYLLRFRGCLLASFGSLLVRLFTFWWSLSRLGSIVYGSWRILLIAVRFPALFNSQMTWVLGDHGKFTNWRIWIYHCKNAQILSHSLKWMF